MRQIVVAMGVALFVGGGVAQAGTLSPFGWGFGGHHAGMFDEYAWKNADHGWWPSPWGRPFGGLGFWGGHGGFLGGHFPGFLGDEWLESRFEDHFEHLMTDYDDGLENIEDFYNSEVYMDVVDGMERIIDHHDWFLMKVDWSIEYVGDLIDHANEHLTDFEDWLAMYQEDESLPEERLMWIEDWLMHAEEHVSMKIDALTMKQMTLMDNLDTYQSFQMELTDYLDEIVAAPSEEETAMMALVPSASLTGEGSRGTVATASVPEPPTSIAAAIALAIACLSARGCRLRACSTVPHGVGS